MRFTEICNKENEIHFLKFMIDKAWHLVKQEADRQYSLAKAKNQIKLNKEKNRKLKSRMTGRKPIDYSAARPLTKNKPKLY